MKILSRNNYEIVLLFIYRITGISFSILEFSLIAVGVTEFYSFKP